MDSRELTFDGSPGADINYLLFFFKNVAQPSEQNKEKAKHRFLYLIGEELRFFYKQLTVKGEVSKERRNYEVVKGVLREK